ncbi:YncE family protein [Alteraurantiacibacter aestuarii]|uniref:Vgb family protein n=1 Tax=Alteraurantiacibacter aestuarii TaxID=650004 RepID=UPI001F23D9D9|nr:YncE family protein [Alteraurantiacibacter aestuarii]
MAGCSVLEAGGGPAASSGDVTGTLFVANKRGNSLSRIDLASGRETADVPTCRNPHELSVSPDGAHVALACYGGSSLEIYNTSDLQRVAHIDLGAGARPHAVVWHANGMLVATAEGRGSLFVIHRPLSARPEVEEIGKGGSGPHMVAVDEAGKVAWGTVVADGSVIRYDLETGEETARRELGGETEAVALSSDGEDLWVGSNMDDKVYRLNPDTLEVTAQVLTGAVPIRLAAVPGDAGPGTDSMVTSNFGDGDLSVIDEASATVSRTILVSGKEEAVQVTLVVSSDGERIYAAETARDTIAEIDFASGKVLRRLPTGTGGDGLAVID